MSSGKLAGFAVGLRWAALLAGLIRRLEGYAKLAGA